MEKGWWVGVIVGLVVVFSIFVVGFYSGSAITGNYVFNWGRTERVQALEVQEVVPKQIGCVGDKVTLSVGSQLDTNIDSGNIVPYGATIILEGVDDDSSLLSVEMESGPNSGNKETDSINKWDTEMINSVKIYVSEVFNSENDNEDYSIITVCNAPKNNQDDSSKLPVCVFVGEVGGGYNVGYHARPYTDKFVNMNTQDICGQFKDKNGAYLAVSYTLRSQDVYYNKDSNCTEYLFATTSTDEFMLYPGQNVGWMFTEVTSPQEIGKCLTSGGHDRTHKMFNTGVLCCSQSEPPEYIPG